MSLNHGQTAEPGEPRFSQRFSRRRGDLLDGGERRYQRSGVEEHFIHIAQHAGPSMIANLIHNLRGTGASVRQVAAVRNQVRSHTPQVRQYGLKCGSVSVNVGYHCNAHDATIKCTWQL